MKNTRVLGAVDEPHISDLLRPHCSVFQCAKSHKRNICCHSCPQYNTCSWPCRNDPERCGMYIEPGQTIPNLPTKKGEKP